MLRQVISIRRGGFFLLLAAFFGSIAGAAAQSRYSIKVKKGRVGLPPGPFSKEKDEYNQTLYLFKAATWAPVWVDLECTANIDQPAIEISVETPDGDDVISCARIVVPTPQPGVSA